MFIRNKKLKILIACLGVLVLLISLKVSLKFLTHSEETLASPDADYGSCAKRCGTTGVRSGQSPSYPSCGSAVQVDAWKEVYWKDGGGYDIVKGCVVCCLAN